MENYLELSKLEKMQIIRSQIKNLQYSKYNFELNIIAENAVDDPNPVDILEYQRQLDILMDKEQALVEELARVELEPDTEPYADTTV